MDELLVAFRAGLTGPAMAAFGPSTETATLEALSRHVAESRAAWPDITVTKRELATELARRLGDGATVEALTGCKASDVYLAIAATAGDVAATRAIVELVEREVGFGAARTRATPDQAAEVRGELHRILFTSDPHRPAAIRGFGGRGDLRGYLRVMATRELVRTMKRGRREEPREEEALFAMIAPGTDPELSILRARFHSGVEDAMRAALRKLGERSRALLRYQLVDGFTVDRVGALYGVHRATAARWVSAARDELGDLIRAEIAAKLAIDVDEVDSIVRMVQSRVDVSIERLIGEVVSRV
jgi:RNA polymerase sigma-70 factor (ECF subfamily)